MISIDEVFEISTLEIERLAFSCSQREHVIARDRLLLQVWKHQREIPTRTVDNLFVRSRRKLESYPEKMRFLVTVHGSGYKLLEQSDISI